jgi:hypothetical protein
MCSTGQNKCRKIQNARDRTNRDGTGEWVHTLKLMMIKNECKIK